MNIPFLKAYKHTKAYHFYTLYFVLIFSLFIPLFIATNQENAP